MVIALVMVLVMVMIMVRFRLKLRIRVKVRISVRSILENSSSVLHNLISQENKDNLERVQKCAMKIILKNKYKDYQTALNKLELFSRKGEKIILENLQRKM